MKIHPTSDYVFFSVIEEKKETKGIILSDISQEKQLTGRGVVESVGPEVKLVKIGNKIIFNAIPGICKSFDLDGKKLYFLQEKQVYGIIK